MCSIAAPAATQLHYDKFFIVLLCFLVIIAGVALSSSNRQQWWCFKVFIWTMATSEGTTKFIEWKANEAARECPWLINVVPCHKLIHWAARINSICSTEKISLVYLWQAWKELHGHHRLKRQLSSTPNLLLHHHSSSSLSREVSSPSNR